MGSCVCACALKAPEPQEISAGKKNFQFLKCLNAISVLSVAENWLKAK